MRQNENPSFAVLNKDYDTTFNSNNNQNNIKGLKNNMPKTDTKAFY